MKHKPFVLEENPFLRKRFRQILWATQVALIFGALNAFFLSPEPSSSGGVSGLRLDILAMLLGAVLVMFVFTLLKKGKQALAGAVYLWLCAVVMTFITWVEGGLYSLAILSFPIIFIFAALFTERRVFLSICSFLSLVVILMGLNHIHAWYPAPEERMVQGVARIIGGLVITSISGYVAWVFGEDMKGAFTELEHENKRVIESQRVIKQLAERDALTGLRNRSAAQACYEKMLLDLKSGQEQIIFFFIDLDNFKAINDLFDHHAGDQLLITISNRLKALIGKGDIACRLGGDEFVVFIRVPQDFVLDRFATNLMDSVAQPHFILGAEAEVTASIGVAIVSECGASFDDVRKKADMAMYNAKQSGKNCYHCYSDELDKEYMKNLNIVNGLKDALSHGLLDLSFQPKVNIQSGKIEGAEALLRWNRGNPEGVRPDEFIPIIESTELIHGIGAWVIKEACIACKQWHEAGYSISVAANVSALQLTRVTFQDAVLDALQVSQLDPQFLEIELTEHSLIKENSEVKAQLHALKSLGVGLAIDDFGTGYSNMSYLTRLKVDVLKLDRSFISQICKSEDHLVIVTAIIQMAKVLGMKVVAEGIETEGEKQLLQGLRCDFGQGFLWSRAVPSSELLGLLKYSLKSWKGMVPVVS